jgi:uncharacterized repeat protein (TIGR03843 family)
VPADELSPLDLLTHGEVEVLGRMPWSSNATFLVTVTCGEQQAQAVYKPRRGERPLWDFPSGLDKREVAAFELSAALGWDLVPPTVLREAPLGHGSVQLFVGHDPEVHYFTLYEAGLHLDELRAMCAFDFVANNTDRKSGHVIVDDADHVWGIDNGLSFHADFKLRTVIWEFGGEEMPASVLRDIKALVDGGVPTTLSSLLDDDECEALLARADALARAGHFPIDESGRRYPWPLV